MEVYTVFVCAVHLAL